MCAKPWSLGLRLIALSIASVVISCQQARLTQPTQVLASPTASAPTTPTLAATATLPATPTLAPSPSPLPPVLQLTFLAGPTDQTYQNSIYAVTVSCLDQPKPCIGPPELLLHTDLNIVAYAWSPNGKRIAVATWTSGPQWDIYVSDSDGSNRKNITHSTGYVDFPAWSPDGRSIAFGTCDQQGCALARVNADGTGRETLLQNTDKSSGPRSPRLISWAPNGKEIAFVAGSGSQYYEQVFVSDLSGTAVTQLTNENTGHLSPSFSHGGDLIAYVREDNQSLASRSDIFIVHPDGTNPTNVTHGLLLSQLDTAWSPSDDWLAFSGDKPGFAAVYNVFLIRPDGTGLIDVTNTGAQTEYHPAWRVVSQP